jgi:preprotein translocase subunit SecF
LPPTEIEQKEKLKNTLSEIVEGEIEELRFETVGPTIGPELIKKTIYAVAVAAGAILLWVALQFKSFKFGTSAILAMFHDSFILIGAFSLLGHYMDIEVDFLFITALLTTLSFSVHDTIVVFDRIRESQRIHGGVLKDLADRAITETMVRSLNNSFTIIFMLVALILLGGTTMKWFAVALLIGTILGTYSSPFVAVPLLVTWDELSKRIKRRR